MGVGIKYLLYTLLKGLFNSYDGMMINTQELLTLYGIDSLTWGNIRSLSSLIFQPFATTIIVICLMLEIAQTTAKVDMLKWEHAIKLGVKMVLAKVAIGIAPAFLWACYQQSIDFIKAVPDSLFPNTGYKLGENMFVVLAITEGSLTDDMSSMFGIMGLTIVLFIVIWLCGLICTALAYGRIFELLVYLVISPIPVAFLPLSGGNEHYSRITINFFKNFIAVSLQGVLMYLMFILYGAICSSRVQLVLEAIKKEVMDEDVALYWFNKILTEMSLLSVVMVFALAKCSSWAKSIMDAH